MKRFHYFAYHAPANVTARKDVRAEFHKFRDTHVLLQLSEALGEADYAFGTILANVPEDMQQRGKAQLRLVDPASELKESDLIVIPTRSPLDDAGRLISTRRGIGVRRSKIPLEEDIFRGLRSVFRHLDRGRVELADKFAKAAGKKYA